MKKNEMKKILKPLIKECIKEVLLEESGMLSHIVSEVAVGLNAGVKTVVKEVATKPMPKTNKNSLSSTKKRLLDSIGKDAYKGVNIFEGTTPTSAPSSPGAPQGPLSGIAPNDPGVDISGLFGRKSSLIYQ